MIDNDKRIAELENENTQLKNVIARDPDSKTQQLAGADQAMRDYEGRIAELEKRLGETEISLESFIHTEGCARDCFIALAEGFGQPSYSGTWPDLVDAVVRRLELHRET